MPRISDADIARIREATDLVALVSERVVLKPKGRQWWGRCPFHNEKTPSFKVDGATGLWHCFGCGEGGDVYGYLMKTENVSFYDAVVTLAERANFDIAFEKGSVQSGLRTQVLAVCKDTAAFFHQVLIKSPETQPAAARAYLASRGFGSAIASEWELGYAPGRGALVAHLRKLGHKEEAMISANVAVNYNGTLRDRFYDRIMFPIFDVQNRCIAFGGRLMEGSDQQGKYLNTNDTPTFRKGSQMYGINLAKTHIIQQKTAMVVEGYTDVIALHVAGNQNVVATLGTALTLQHVKLLSRFASRVIYVFDGDEAGLRAADRAVEFIDETITPEAGKNPIEIDVLVLPQGADPADMAATQEGRAAFEKQLGATVPLIDFAITRRLAKYNLNRPEQRQRAIEESVRVLAPIKTSVMATDYAQVIVDKLWAGGAQVSLDQVLTSLKQSRVLPSYERDSQFAGNAVSCDKKVAPESEVIDSVEISLLALAISTPSSRKAISDAVTPEMLTTHLAREVLFAVQSAEDTSQGIALLELLPRDAIAQLSAFDLAANRTASDELVGELIASIVSTYSKSRIRDLTLELRGISDATLKKELAAKIVKLQQKVSL